MSWRPWRRKPKPPEHHPLPGWPAAAAYPDSLSDDLRAALYASLGVVSARERQQAHWVMTLEWMNECRKLAIAMESFSPFDPDAGPDDLTQMVLLGLPVEVRDGSGPPHLEPKP